MESKLLNQDLKGFIKCSEYIMFCLIPKLFETLKVCKLLVPCSSHSNLIMKNYSRISKKIITSHMPSFLISVPEDLKNLFKHNPRFKFHSHSTIVDSLCQCIIDFGINVVVDNHQSNLMNFKATFHQEP